MPIKDNEIFGLIERISDHYQNNLNNRFVRKALISMKLDRTAWDHIERLTVKIDNYKMQGYDLHELYEQIHSAAQLVHHARAELLPNIRSLLAGGTNTFLAREAGRPEADRVLRDMAVNNFSANLGILADLVNELYMKAVALDRSTHPKGTPLYQRMPELKEIGRLLV